MVTTSKRTSDTRAPKSKTRHPAPSVQKVDRRVERTQRQLSDSLMALILERGWDAVTVRDVCEHANIGRSTFYLHYADKESLLLGGFDELHEDLSELTRDAKRPFAFAEALLEHALGNERLFRAMVGRQSWQQMQWRFRDLLVTLLLAELPALKVPAASRPATARFIAGGFLEHLMQALEDAGKANSNELAARFRVLALGVAAAARKRTGAAGVEWLTLAARDAPANQRRWRARAGPRGPRRCRRGRPGRSPRGSFPSPEAPCPAGRRRGARWPGRARARRSSSPLRSPSRLAAALSPCPSRSSAGSPRPAESRK